MSVKSKGFRLVQMHDDDTVPGHSAYLFEAYSVVAPVVDGEDRHYRIEARVVEGQGFGASRQARRRLWRTGPAHCDAWLNRDYRPVRRFVGASTRTNI